MHSSKKSLADPQPVLQAGSLARQGSNDLDAHNDHDLSQVGKYIYSHACIITLQVGKRSQPHDQLLQY